MAEPDIIDQIDAKAVERVERMLKALEPWLLQITRFNCNDMDAARTESATLLAGIVKEIVEMDA